MDFVSILLLLMPCGTWLFEYWRWSPIVRYLSYVLSRKSNIGNDVLLYFTDRVALSELRQKCCPTDNTIHFHYCLDRNSNYYYHQLHLNPSFGKRNHFFLSQFRFWKNRFDIVLQTDHRLEMLPQPIALVCIGVGDVDV